MPPQLGRSPGTFVDDPHFCQRRWEAMLGQGGGHITPYPRGQQDMALVAPESDDAAAPAEDAGNVEQEGSATELDDAKLALILGNLNEALERLIGVLVASISAQEDAADGLAGDALAAANTLSSTWVSLWDRGYADPTRTRQRWRASLPSFLSKAWDKKGGQQYGRQCARLMPGAHV